jgi:hypothetical protein
LRCTGLLGLMAATFSSCEGQSECLAACGPSVRIVVEPRPLGGVVWTVSEPGWPDTSVTCPIKSVEREPPAHGPCLDGGGLHHSYAGSGTEANGFPSASVVVAAADGSWREEAVLLPVDSAERNRVCGTSCMVGAFVVER